MIRHQMFFATGLLLGMVFVNSASAVGAPSPTPTDQVTPVSAPLPWQSAPRSDVFGDGDDLIALDCSEAGTHAHFCQCYPEECGRG